MDWFEELGFNENPFDSDPAFSARYSAGLEKEMDELVYYVNSGSLVFVEGASGSGKSVLLKMLAGKLGGRAVFVDGAGNVDIRSIIRKKTSFISALLGRPPKNIVLLVDAAAGLSHDSMEMIKYNFDNNHFAAVILAGASIKSAGLSQSILDRIGSRVIHMPELTEEAALLMVGRRLGSSAILEDDAIRKIYKKSGKNAKRFLALCEEAGKAAASSKPVAKEEDLKA